MVPDQWSNDAMVSMNRCGLVVTFFLCSISAFAICDNQSKDSKDILFSFTRKMYRILPPSRDTPSLMKCLKLIWLAPTPLFDRIPAHRGRHYRKKLKADRLQYFKIRTDRLVIMWVCPLTASIDWFFSLEPGTLFSYPRYYLPPLEEMISNRFSFLLDNKETLTKAQQSQALKPFLSPPLFHNICKGIEFHFIHLLYRPKHCCPFHTFSSRPRYCILTVAWWGSFSPLTKQQRHLSQYGIFFFLSSQYLFF